MDCGYSLSELLSFALVAFTIEFDNELELELPHSTTRYGKSAGAKQTPWLISMVMYQNCLQYLAPEGITLRELYRRARTATNFDGMQRWGFILAVPDLEAPLPLRTREKPRLDLVLLPTKAGHLTQQICQPLIASIESRWQSRFGNTAIVSLRQSLSEIVVQLDPQLPDCMPILGYGLTASTLPGKILESVVSNPTEVDKLPLPSMLARVLNAFATEFETESQVSLAICANVLRVADQPALLRDLPRISGASKEAIAVAWGYLCRHGFATGESSSGSRSKALVLTPKGLAARRSWVELIPAIESRWRVRFGIAVEKLHQSLSQLVAESPEELLPLVRGIEPGPENWRGKLPKPETLPHFPLVLHRGGFPDGS